MKENIMVFGSSKIVAKAKWKSLVDELYKAEPFEKMTCDYVETATTTLRYRQFEPNCRAIRYAKVYVDEKMVDDPEIMIVIISHLIPPFEEEDGTLKTNETYDWKSQVIIY